MDGFLIINKASNWTSHDVVAKLRSITGIRKIGHTGTLDPFATGVLVVGLGKATKLFEYLTSDTKEYLASFRLGATSDTDDKTGNISINEDATSVTREDLEKAVKKFIGKIKQTPPQYSAIKIKGKKMYQLARKGEKVEVQPREVEIFKYKVIKYRYPKVKVRLKVGSGTYIRSLARDLGAELGVGAHVEKLKRTKVGHWQIEDAIKLKRLNKNNWTKYLQPIDLAIENMERITITDKQASAIRQGIKIEFAHSKNQDDLILVDSDDKLVAVADYENNTLSPRKVF